MPTDATIASTNAAPSTMNKPVRGMSSASAFSFAKAQPDTPARIAPKMRKKMLMVTITVLLKFTQHAMHFDGRGRRDDFAKGAPALSAGRLSMLRAANTDRTAFRTCSGREKNAPHDEREASATAPSSARASTYVQALRLTQSNRRARAPRELVTTVGSGCSASKTKSKDIDVIPTKANAVGPCMYGGHTYNRCHPCSCKGRQWLVRGTTTYVVLGSPERVSFNGNRPRTSARRRRTGM